MKGETWMQIAKVALGIVTGLSLFYIIGIAGSSDLGRLTLEQMAPRLLIGTVCFLGSFAILGILDRRG